MKLYNRPDKVKEPSRFTGRVKVTISGLDQHSVLMSGKRGQLPAKHFVVADTTVEEVYSVLRKAIEEKVKNDG